MEWAIRVLFLMNTSGNTVVTQRQHCGDIEADADLISPGAAHGVLDAFPPSGPCRIWPPGLI
jgi:hypothetical protein